MGSNNSVTWLIPEFNGGIIYKNKIAVLVKAHNEAIHKGT